MRLNFALPVSLESTAKGRCFQTALPSLFLLDLSRTAPGWQQGWVPGAGERGYPALRLSFQRSDAELSPHPPGFLCKAHSADHHCCLCRPSPPTNPYRACCLKAKSPWANICYLKLYFIFLSRCFFFSPLSRMISLCIGKAWTSDLWSTQSNKASRQQSGTSSNILR